METANKNNKTKWIVIGLSCLLVIALIGYIILQNRQIRKLSPGVNPEMTADSESVVKDAPGQNEAVQNNADRSAAPAAGGSGEIEELEYQLDAAEEELDAAHKQLSDEAAKKAENAKNMIEMQKKMLQDPAYQKTLRSTYKGMLDSIYGSLYKKLALTPEKQDAFQELLLDQMMVSLETNLDTLGAEPSEEKREEVRQQAEELKKEFDAKVSALLDSGDFNTYESYRDTLSERQVLSGFAESLGEGEKLTEAQMESLIGSMYKERKDIYSRQDWEEESVTFLSEINDEGIAKMMDMNDRTFDGYIKGAGVTLSATQMEQFKAYLKNRSDMTESALKMTAQMYGGQTIHTSTGEGTEY